MFGGVLEWRPRPTPGCSVIAEEDEYTKLLGPATKNEERWSKFAK
jgi:hypothetical protein